MNQYYYSTNDYVWDTWFDSQPRSWLVENGVVKEKDASKLTRDKSLLVCSLYDRLPPFTFVLRNSYNSATSTITSVWNGSSRMDIFKLPMLRKLNEAASSSSSKKSIPSFPIRSVESVLTLCRQPQSKDPTQHPYVAWPTPRLCAYLIESGVKESEFSKTRQELLWRVSYKSDSAKQRTSDESSGVEPGGQREGEACSKGA